jgi:hypothetical protein
MGGSRDHARALVERARVLAVEQEAHLFEAQAARILDGLDD